MNSCAACGQPLIASDTRHGGVYVDVHGKPHDHLLCARCFQLAMSSKKEHARIANLIELRFIKPEGAA